MSIVSSSPFSMVTTSSMGSISLVFHNDEDIIESLNAPDYPWDDMHHRSYFSPHDAFSPENPSNPFSIETKDFIPPGHVDWFKNPISTPDTFE
jgi:hypothetical protein